MGNKFTRNITGIKKIEDQGLETNNQNDLLSEVDGNVHVRTLDYYHCLTDNVKNINGNTVTMAGGNKLVLPIITSVNQYEVDKKHYINVEVDGDVSQDYGLTKGKYSEWVKGEYDLENNVTTFIVEVVGDSNYYKQVTVGLISPPENEGEGEGFIPLYKIDTLYMNRTDYNVTDNMSPKFLIGRELIATKLELKKVKEDIEKLMETKFTPYINLVNIYYSPTDKKYKLSITANLTGDYTIDVLKGQSVIQKITSNIEVYVNGIPQGYVYTLDINVDDVVNLDLYSVDVKLNNKVVYNNSFNLLK